jgi:hypothetical protein
MKQIARNVTMEGYGILRDCRYLLHDRDTKYTQSFRAIIASGQVEPLALPAQSPNLNAYAERWVRSVLGMIVFDEFVQRLPQGALAQKDHLGQALILRRRNRNEAPQVLHRRCRQGWHRA